MQILFADAATGAHSCSAGGPGTHRRCHRGEAGPAARPCSKRRPASPACTPAGTRPSSSSGRRRPISDRLQDVIGTLEAQAARSRAPGAPRQAVPAALREDSRDRGGSAAHPLDGRPAARVEEVDTRGRTTRPDRVAEATGEPPPKPRAAKPTPRRSCPSDASRRQSGAAALHRLRIEHERLAEEEERVARAREDECAQDASRSTADIEREEALAQGCGDRRRSASTRSARGSPLRPRTMPQPRRRPATREKKRAPRSRLSSIALRPSLRRGHRAEAEREALGEADRRDPEQRRQRLEHDLPRGLRAERTRSTGAGWGLPKAGSSEAEEEERNPLRRPGDSARESLQKAEAARGQAEDRERALRERLREAGAALAGSEAERAAPRRAA